MEHIRVLLADDHPLFRAGLRRVLESEPDIEVVGEAGNGDAALALASELVPDVAVLDVRMPGGGLAAARELRRRAPTVRIMICTAHEEGEYLLEAFKAGAGGYLLKDAPPAEVIFAVRRVAQGETLLTPEMAARFMGEFRMHSETAQHAALLDRLTPREEEILRLIAAGADNLQISTRLGIAERTVKAHITSIFRKLEVNDRTNAAIIALKAGIERR